MPDSVVSAALLTFLAATAAPAVPDSACIMDGASIERGERRPLLICGAGITPAYAIDGLQAAGLHIDYQQFLKRCAVDRREPGLFLWLSAGDAARGAALTVRDAPGGQPVCAPLPVQVPLRLPLGTARLQPVAGMAPTVYQLEVRARPGQDLADACGADLEFPPDPMRPSLALVAPDALAGAPRRFRRAGRPLLCRPDVLEALVHVVGQQRFPAAIVAHGVRAGAGAPADGIAWASLPAPDWAQAMAPGEAKFITVNGYRTRYFDAGQGEDALVFVHGGQPDPLSPTAETWRQNFHGLAQHFRVIAFDGLGHGYTDIPATAQDYQHYYQRSAAHLAGFVQALELPRVHLVASSQGGWPATRLALDRPDLVKCLVSVDTVMALYGEHGKGGGSRFAYALFNITPATGPTLESVLRWQGFEFRTWRNLSFADAGQALQRARALPQLEQARQQLAAIRMSPAHPEFRQLQAQAIAEIEAGRLTVPQLVIWGAGDRLAPLDAGVNFFRLVSSAAARAQLVVLGDAGHVPFIEYPEEFNRAVAGFCGVAR